MAARRARDALFLLLDRHERSRFRPVSARQCALDQCQFRRHVVARRPSCTGTADPGNSRADTGRHDNPDPRRSPLGQAGPRRGRRGSLSGRGSVSSRFRSNVGDGSSGSEEAATETATITHLLSITGGKHQGEYVRLGTAERPREGGGNPGRGGTLDPLPASKTADSARRRAITPRFLHHRPCSGMAEKLP